MTINRRDFVDNVLAVASSFLLPVKLSPSEDRDSGAAKEAAFWFEYIEEWTTTGDGWPGGCWLLRQGRFAEFPIKVNLHPIEGLTYKDFYDRQPAPCEIRGYIFRKVALQMTTAQIEVLRRLILPLDLQFRSRLTHGARIEVAPDSALDRFLRRLLMG
jgi:hypothetical protein